jgi:hypothetical protein
MKNLSVIWNFFWWKYHIGHARKHDARIDQIYPNWRIKVEETVASDGQ